MKTPYSPRLAFFLSMFLTSAQLFAAPKDLSLPTKPAATGQASKLELETNRPAPSTSDPRNLDGQKKSSSKNEDRQETSKEKSSSMQLGNSSGGGNTKVETTDGVPHLASEYVTIMDDADISQHLPPSKPYTIPKVVRNELGKLQRILHSTLLRDIGSESFDSDGKRKIEDTDFIATEILDSGIQLLLVNEIPDGVKDPVFSQCQNLTRNAQVPAGARVSRSACTLYSTPYTLMIESDFAPPRNASELRFQTLSLAHEGLRRRGLKDEYVTYIDQSLASALDLMNEQIAGSRRELTTDETEKLRWLLRLSFQYGLASKNQERYPNWLSKTSIWNNGGGYIYEWDTKRPNQIAPGAYIGVGSSILYGRVIPEDVILIDTNICQAQGCKLGVGAQVISSQVYLDWNQVKDNIFAKELNPVQIGERSVIQNLDVKYSSLFNIGDHVRISDFKTESAAISIDSRAEVHKVSIFFDHGYLPGKGYYYNAYYDLKLEADARLENIDLMTSMSLKLKTGTSLGFPSERHRFALVPSRRGFFQNTTTIGLTLGANTRIDLDEFAKTCHSKDGVSRIEMFTETVNSTQDLQRFCSLKTDN
jgi:hypothetical protein